MLRQAIDLRAGFIGVTPLTPPEGFPSHVGKLEACQVEFIGSREPGEPGVCGSIASAKGRQLFVDPQDNVKIGAVLSPETLAAIHGAKLLHVSSLLEPIGSQEFKVACAVTDFVQRFKELNPEAVATVDPGDPWTRPGSRSDEVNRVLALADMLFLNDGEYHQLTGGSPENRFSAQVLRDVAPRAAVHVLKELTGVRLLHPSGLTSFALGRADGDKAIDPTGAGDAVAAGILGSVVEGRTLVEGSDLALRLAALRVSGVGDDGHRNLRKKLGELWREPAPTVQPTEKSDSAHRPIVAGFLGLIVLCLGLVGGLATPLGDYAYPSGLLLAAVVYVGDLIIFRRGKLARERFWVGVAVLLAIASAVWLGILLGEDDPRSRKNSPSW